MILGSNIPRVLGSIIWRVLKRNTSDKREQRCFTCEHPYRRRLLSCRHESAKSPNPWSVTRRHQETSSRASESRACLARATNVASPACKKGREDEQFRSSSTCKKETKDRTDGLV